MPINTGPFRMANDTSPKLTGNLDTNGNDIVTPVGGLQIGQAPITSSTTNDYGLNIISTLNDGGAAGGSDTFDLIKGNITATDLTGWDNVALLNLKVDNKSVFILDPVNASLSLSDFGSGGFLIGAMPQNPAGDDPGASLTIQGGPAAGATTGDAGGSVNLKGGSAAGSGNNDGGGVVIYPGTPTGSGKSFGLQLWNVGATENAVLLHDGTDLQVMNGKTGGGVSFLDNSMAEIFFFDGAEVSYSGYLKRTVTMGITASVTQTQGQQPLLAEKNIVTTVANVNDVVTMPTVVPGMEVFIANLGAKVLKIFPASGDDLGPGVNTPITLEAGTKITHIGIDSGKWLDI